MAITGLKVAQYRSIRRMDLELGPVTILVGPNGTGKTNILSAINELRRKMYSSANRRMEGNLNENGRSTLTLEFQQDPDPETLEWTVTSDHGDLGALRANGTEVNGERKRRAIARAKHMGMVHEESHLNQEYWAEDLDLGSRITGWKHPQDGSGPRPSPACQRAGILMGALRKWDTILLDNPDAGLHTGAVIRLAELIRSQKDRQFIIATHSTTLLDQLGDPGEIVHVSAGTGDAGTTILREPDPEGTRREMRNRGLPLGQCLAARQQEP